IGGACLFLNHTDNLVRMGGIWKASPWLGVFFLCQAFSLAGVPPLSGFWGKFLILRVGVEQGHAWLVGAALLASLLTLVSMLKIWLAAFWRHAPETGIASAASPPIRTMTALAGVMTVVSLCIGLGAEWFLRAAATAIETLMDQHHYQDAVFSVGGKGVMP